MSTLSRLSFKDPERALKGLYHMDMESIVNEETSTDSTITPRDGHSRTSSNTSSQLSERLSTQLSVGNSELIPEAEPESETLNREMRDSRAQKIKEILKREAPC